MNPIFRDRLFREVRWLQAKLTCASSMHHHNLQNLLHAAHAQVEGLLPVRLRRVLLPARARRLCAHIVLPPTHTDTTVKQPASLPMLRDCCAPTSYCPWLF